MKKSQPNTLGHDLSNFQTRNIAFIREFSFYEIIANMKFKMMLFILFGVKIKQSISGKHIRS